MLVGFAGWYDSHDGFTIFAMYFRWVNWWIIGPLVYFYVKSILNPDFRLSKKDRPHFYLIILDFIPNLVLILFYGLKLIGISLFPNNDLLWDFIESYNLYVDIPRWLSLAIYVYLAWKLLSQYKSPQNVHFIKWAKQFTLGITIFSIIWLLHLIPYSIPVLSNDLLANFGWYPIYIPVIILIYWLGVNGLIISFQSFNKQSSIDEVNANSALEALDRLMNEEQLYLNPKLKLNDVVTQSSIPQKTISAVLNQYRGKSFNDYINAFRVEELKKRLLSDNSENFSITGLALECGFNSQATFQRVFKAQTKLTPKEFQKMHKSS